MANNIEKKEENPTCQTRLMPTFFSNLKVSFTDVIPDQNSLIPMIAFLEACRNLLTIFDILGSTTFSPVKMDLSGNIQKLQVKYDSNKERFSMLQALINSEIEARTTKAKNSATDALLWLKRGLEFICQFLHLYLSGDPDLTKCGFAAYDRTLKNYHNWIIRGAFALASKALPYRQDFITMMGLHNSDIDRCKLEQQVNSDCSLYIESLDTILLIINNFYTQHNLDSNVVVS